MTIRDAQGRERRGVYLPADCWGWLESTAERDGSSRSDLLEGLVLLAMDADVARERSEASDSANAEGGQG